MLIEATALSRSFGSHPAVSEVTFTVAEPGIVGLLGANGAGKSTTMRMLAGTLAPSGGGARIAGFDVTAERKAAQRALGYLPEAANGFGALTVGEFLLFAAEAHGTHGYAARTAVRDVIALLGLTPAVGRPLGRLSKGWRQRAWLAQALIHGPEVLILDEPTDGLDPRQKEDLRALLIDFAKTRAILMSSHILEEAEQLCDRLLVMNAGRLVADDKKAAFLDTHGRLAPALLRLMGDGSPADRAAGPTAAAAGGVARP